MNRQSLDFMREKHLPRYGDTDEAFEKGKHYIFSKKEHMDEPRSNSRALRVMASLGEALEWGRNNMGADLFIIVSGTKEAM